MRDYYNYVLNWWTVHQSRYTHKDLEAVKKFTMTAEAWNMDVKNWPELYQYIKRDLFRDENYLTRNNLNKTVEDYIAFSISNHKHG